RIAADLRTAGGREAIGSSAVDQRDDLKCVRRQASPNRFFLVGGIDGNAAHRLLVGVGVMRPRREQQCQDPQQSEGTSHERGVRDSVDFLSWPAPTILWTSSRPVVQTNS